MKIKLFFLTAFLSIALSQPVEAQTWIRNNTHGFGDANNTGVYSMAVYSNNLYVATENFVTGVEVWRYDGTTWTQVNTDGFGDTNLLSWWMTVYNNNLYVGTLNPTTGGGGMEIRWDHLDPGQYRWLRRRK